MSSNRRRVERKPYQDPRPIPGVSIAKYHPRAVPYLTLAKVRCPKVPRRDYSFFAKSKSEQFARRSASKLTNGIGSDRIGQAQVISSLLNLSRKSITFEETNRPDGRGIKREREKIRRKEEKRVQMRTRSRLPRRGVAQASKAGNELAIIIADIFPRYPCRAAQS